MQNYDYPAKNWVRSWFFTTVDRLIAQPTQESTYAVYFPSIQNLEGSSYEVRKISAYPVERDGKFIAKMGPLRGRVFQGTLGEWITSHAASSGSRLHIANLDFEGKLNTAAHELISLFRVFPSDRGGLLGLTTFANMDPESVESGIVHANAFDSILDGQVRNELHALYNQLRPYLESRKSADAVAHAQFCRDFGVLWRVMMGLALWESPSQGSGDFRPSLHRDLTILLGEMHREVGRIRMIGNHNSFPFVDTPQVEEILAEVSTPLFPLCLERVLYRSVGNNRMSTWIIFLGRLHAPIPMGKVAQQLWQLYSRSPLTFVLPSGRVQTYRPR